MDSRKLVLKQTALMLVGELICCALMVGVYAALDHFKVLVIWSSLAGTAIVTLNHFFMSITVCLSAEQAERGELEQAKKAVQLSSILRLLCMGVALFVCIRLGADVIALVLPLAFSRPIIMLYSFFGRKGDEWKGSK